jgi:short subunit dehydrogenase-like uncharacterized protein
LYGASGYTAGLLLPRLEQRGLEVIAAGRDAAKVQTVARRFGIEYRVFDLSQPSMVDEQLSGIALVLNAAGPYVCTAQPMIDACLRRRVDYLDLSGEIDPLQYAEQCDGFACSQGVMLLPAVGFDVVPTDCLAVHLAERLPDAESLTIGISPSNLVSRGSLSTLVAQAGIPVKTRRAGVLDELPSPTELRQVDFGDGTKLAAVVSWGDLVTAHHSTGIPNIEVCFEATAFRWLLVTANRYWGFWLETPAARSWMHAVLSLAPTGPAEAARQQQHSVIVAEVRRDEQCARARLVTPEAYTFTAEAAARCAEAVLEGARRPGFCTPGQLFGADFVLSIPGVARQDLT